MKKLILIVLFSLCNIAYPQKETTIVKQESTPGGYFENLYDRYGNKFDISDFVISKSKFVDGVKKNSTLISCANNSSIFNLYFEDGSGMEGTDPVQTARRNVVCQVFKDISDFITQPTSPLQPTSATKVNIWIRNPLQLGMPSNALGGASSFYVTPYKNVSSFGGIADNEIWKTIHSGADSYTKVVQILSTADSGQTSSGLIYHGYMAMNFNKDGNNNPLFNWNTNLSTLANSNEYDLYTVVLHEVVHALGLTSLISSNGSSLLGNGRNYYSRYDTFLKTSSNASLLSSGLGCQSMYNNTFVASLVNSLHPSSDCNFNTSNCQTVIRFKGSALTNVDIPVYTPNCWENGSSIGHFEDSCFTVPIGFTSGNDLYFSMSNANFPGSNKRYLKKEERLALAELGYNVNPTFGINTTFQGSPPANHYSSSVINGINVAGVNDGLSEINKAYIYIGEATSANPIIINSSTDTTKRILNNDINATSFECLEDVFSIATIYPTSGGLTTNVTFSSTENGLHLLRYIPVNSDGQRGNITYIYVYVGNTCGTPNSCDLIVNGRFEEKSTLPQLPGDFTACSWYAASGSPDYYHTDAPYMNVPCAVFGHQNEINNLHAFSGLAATYPSNSYNESMGTRLTNVLLPNHTYQLSFNVSLGEVYSDYVFKIQAYLSPTQAIDYYNFNYNMLKQSSVYVTNNLTWDTVNIVLETGNNTNLQYLIIGAIKDPNIISNQRSDIFECNYNNYHVDNGAYYFIDNVKLIPIDLSSFVVPTPLCINQTISDLRNYITGLPNTGSFSVNGTPLGNGIYSFIASNYGVGTHLISYTYSNQGCPITINCNVVVNSSSILPTFNQVASVCYGSIVSPLPTTSTNGVSGSWSPPINNTATTTYTFTPAQNVCATTTTMTIVVNQNGTAGCSTSCPASLLFNVPETLTTPKTYQVSSDIVANNNYTLNLGADITMTASNSITLQPNSYLKSGSKYLGKIAACSPNVNKTSQTEIETKTEILDEIGLFPNPTSGNVTITSKSKNFNKVLITSIDGKVVFERDLENVNEFTFSIEHFTKGMYLISIIENDGNVTSKKLIKE